MRPANLFVRSLLFYERTDMSSGARRARAANGRDRGSAKHVAVGHCGGSEEAWWNNNKNLVIP